MKKHIYLSLGTVFLFCLSAFAQVKKSESIAFDHIYLTANNKQQKLSSLNDKTIANLLGSPEKISTKKWETAGTDKVKTYYYPAGKISTEAGQLSFITLTKPSFAFTLLINKKLTSPLVAGGSVELIKSYFPAAWAARDKNGVFVSITNSHEASWLRFTFTGNTIKTVEYAVDES